MNRTVICHATIYAEDRVIDNGFVAYQNNKIIEVDSMEKFQSSPDDIMIDGKHCSVIPGMIDIHIHGANGADVMDATPEALQTIAAALVQEGTTSFLATTMTQHLDVVMKALENVQDYHGHQESTEAEIIGIHLEGPFINQDNAGAQLKQYMIDPDVAVFDQFQKASGGLIKVVTVAPERPNGINFVKYLIEQGVIASIGHSGAKSEQAELAIATGASHITHLYNGLTPFHHREAGVVGTALLNKKVFTEMIVDGYHIAPYVVNLTYQIRGSQRILLITDSMRAKYMSDGIYDLGGQAVCVLHGEARLDNGALAGSTLKMKDAIKLMMTYTGCSLADIILMTATNQAQQLGVFDRKGSIAVGKDADLVVLDQHNQVIKTICRGTLAYCANM